VCALKKIPKEIIKEENILNQLTRELKIQMFLDHPNIIKLYSFFHDEDNIYLLLELGSSGQLYKVIKEKERMTEASTSYTIKQVCEAIRSLHYYNIIHRDLKP
jgi:aurora kinase